MPSQTTQHHTRSYFFLLLGRCVSAEPAAVFEALLDPARCKVFDAADAAFFEVTLGGAFAWDKAEPAADFADLLELELLKTLDAAEAARLLVTSFLAIFQHLKFLSYLSTNL